MPVDGPPLPRQSSLFGTGVPRAGSCEAIRRVALDDACWYDTAPGWLAGPDSLMDELLDILPWEHHRRPMYDKVVDVPRLTAFGAEASAELPEVVTEVAVVLSERYGRTFDQIGCNLYRDGRDSVAWHGDRVRLTQREPLVAIVSLGERRPFLLRPRGGGRSIRLRLGDGDLLVMGGACQHRWEHAVPKVARAGPRLSVTYRHGGERDAPD